MLILNIRSGLADILTSWASMYDYCANNGDKCLYMFDTKHNNCLNFENYIDFSELGIDIYNSDRFNEIRKIRVDMKISSNSEGGWKNLNVVIANRNVVPFPKDKVVYLYGGTRWLSALSRPDKCKYVLEKIRPSAIVSEKIESYMKSTQFDLPIGMHIRRTDNKNSIMNSPDILFKDKIWELVSENPNARIFLCTDDDGVRDEFCKTWKDNVFSRQVDKRRSGAKAYEDAVIDMFLLSRCSSIFGSIGSGFSTVSSIIGHNKLTHLINREKK